MRKRLGVLGLASVVAMVGCSRIPHLTPLYSRAGAPPPTLSGKRVAVLPPFGVGEEQAPAAVGMRAADSIFASEVAGVLFSPPTEVLHSMGSDLMPLEDLRSRITERVPVELPADGKVEQIFDGVSASGVALGGRLLLTLRQGSPAGIPLTPDSVPKQTWVGDADYVLASVTFSTYRENTFVLTLLGLIPVWGGKRLEATRPRAIFALYDSSDGRRVWESLVAVDGVSFGQATYHRTILDQRAMPFIGAAFLLTRDIEIPISRLKSANSSE